MLLFSLLSLLTASAESNPENDDLPASDPDDAEHSGSEHGGSEHSGSEHGEKSHHRSFGLKAVNLTAVSEEATAWLGLGFILELPVNERWLIELAGHSLWGTERAPGFAVPVDVLVKRVWSHDRWVFTAGLGPSLTGFWKEESFDLFPGFLGSAGCSYWLGDRRSWGLLVEVDVGGADEEDVLVGEFETALGAVFTF